MIRRNVAIGAGFGFAVLAILFSNKDASVLGTVFIAAALVLDAVEQHGGGK